MITGAVIRKKILSSILLFIATGALASSNMQTRFIRCLFRIRHSDIVNGGKLVLQMSDLPEKGWGEKN
ncbi:hypothetical protein KK083_12385 [Fulvivirgaceae bacterium PWU4]|uniref:Uncharacterized protein n=1 Tax=Chryseosolibacter histidini TaxID=2782349 RepID=A0AAP2DJX1_9BACT|nr:hypothetical protein [Chryseosolibacter histidini]MBT1697680.1 hypothetical protein [Chryseosolibacter histidini]